MNDERRPQAPSEAAAAKPLLSPDSSGGVGRTAAATLTAALDPARAFIGSLLWLAAEEAAEATTGIDPESDLTDPRLRQILVSIARLADRNVAPDPAAVALDLRSAGDVTGAHTISAASMLLIELYEQAVTAGNVGYFRDAMLWESVRRRVALAGARLTQAAESGSDDALIPTVLAELDAIKQVRDRRVDRIVVADR